MHARTSALKKKIIGGVSDVLSAPKRAYYGHKRSVRESDANILKRANQLKGMPKFEAGVGPTEAFKVRSVAEGIKNKYIKK